MASTIRGWKTEGQTEFYGTHAAKAAKVTGRRSYIIENGVEFFPVADSAFDIFCAQAVGRGYCLEINI